MHISASHGLYGDIMLLYINLSNLATKFFPLIMKDFSFTNIQHTTNKQYLNHISSFGHMIQCVIVALLNTANRQQRITVF